MLQERGVSIVELPTIYDEKHLLPFLLINDHSILLVRNPKKDLLNMLKQVVRTGSYMK